MNENDICLYFLRNVRHALSETTLHLFHLITYMFIRPVDPLLTGATRRINCVIGHMDGFCVVLNHKFSQNQMPFVTMQILPTHEPNPPQPECISVNRKTFQF